VALTNVVGRAEPFTCTTDELTNPDPLTVRVKVGPNTSAVDGEIFEIEGTGLLTVNVTAAEVPPPGPGVKTVMEREAATARSDEGIAAVSCVLLTKVVVRFEPLTRTTELLTKLLPLTVSVNPEVPAVALLGEILLNDGDGLLTASDIVPEAEPSGLVTPIARVPVDAMSLAGIAAVSRVPLTNVVVRFEPFTWTTDPFTKFEPLAVSVKAGPPAVAVLGEMLASDGGELVTVKVSAVDVPPPGAGLKTAMDSVPAAAMSDAGIAAVN